MADDEEICVLSGEEFTESLVLLDLQQPHTLQEQTKRYSELKHSFLALLKAYEDLRGKLFDARNEISQLKKRNSSSMHVDSVSLSANAESPDLAKVILMYNEKVRDIIDQVHNQFTTDQDGSVAANQVRQHLCTTEAETQYENRSFIDKPVQTGDSLMPLPGESMKTETTDGNVSDGSLVFVRDMDVAPNQSLPSFVSEGDKGNQVMIPSGQSSLADLTTSDASDSEEVDAASHTIQPTGTSSDVRIAEAAVSRLLVENTRTGNTTQFNYSCPVCGQNFEFDALEAQAVAHLMQCTAAKDTQRRECPMCNRSFKLTESFNQQEFELHVQCCCDAGDIGAEVVEDDNNSSNNNNNH